MYDTAVSDEWIFGYGSLVWRPGFAFRERHPAYIKGWLRRFWQASPDHRGTAEAPGRVVTLVPSPASTCWGMAYRVDASVAAEVLGQLDHREKAGYERVRVTLRFRARPSVEDVLVYVAAAGNPNFVGPASLAEIAEVARVAHGPSGANREYVLRLADALSAMDAADDHVTALARLVAADAGE